MNLKIQQKLSKQELRKTEKKLGNLAELVQEGRTRTKSKFKKSETNWVKSQQVLGQLLKIQFLDVRELLRGNPICAVLNHKEITTLSLGYS